MGGDGKDMTPTGNATGMEGYNGSVSQSAFRFSEKLDGAVWGRLSSLPQQTVLRCLSASVTANPYLRILECCFKGARDMAMLSSRLFPGCCVQMWL